MATNTNTPTGTNVTNTTQDNPSEAPAVELTKSGAPETEDLSMADIAGVRFTGFAGQGSSRSISIADFKSAGVEAKKDLVWNHDNNFTVPVGDINAKVRDHLLADGEFELVPKA